MHYDPLVSPLYKLLLEGRQLKLAKGQVIGAFYNTPMLHLVKTGFIKRYLIKDDGSQAIQLIYGPEDVLPMTPVYQQVYQMDIYRGPEVYYYEAMVPVDLYSIHLDTLSQALEVNPLIYKDLFYASGSRLNAYIHSMEDMSLRSVNKRLAHIILFYAERFGESSPEGLKISLPLTHQTLAAVLNLARETITRAVSGLTNKGLIASSGKHIIIPDMEALKHYARS